MTKSLKKRVTRELTDRLGPEAWIEAGRDFLKEGGVGAVKIELLAVRLGVTTGSFYWHFKDRPALLAAMLSDWEATNSAGFIQAVSDHPGDRLAQFDAMVMLWLNEEKYSSAWDSAVRDWARTDAQVETAVRRVDALRVNLLHQIFSGLGFEETEALIRARITYFHQVGYYALQISETLSDRILLKPVYVKVLMGGSTKL